MLIDASPSSMSAHAWIGGTTCSTRASMCTTVSGWCSRRRQCDSADFELPTTPSSPTCVSMHNHFWCPDRGPRRFAHHCRHWSGQFAAWVTARDCVSKDCYRTTLRATCCRANSWVERCDVSIDRSNSRGSAFRHLATAALCWPSALRATLSVTPISSARRTWIRSRTCSRCRTWNSMSRRRTPLSADSRGYGRLIS